MAIPRIDNIRDPSLETLVKLAAQGDTTAKRKLVEQLMPRVRTVVQYIAPGDRDADDIVQLAFIEILRSAATFRGECRVETWASRIIVRTAMHYIKGRRKRFFLFRGPEEKQPIDFDTPECQSETFRLRRQIKALLNRIPVEQRIALVLKLVEGMSVNEISEVTKSPVNTVRERLRVGRKRFRRYLVQDPVLREWMERRGR